MDDPQRDAPDHAVSWFVVERPTDSGTVFVKPTAEQDRHDEDPAPHR